MRRSTNLWRVQDSKLDKDIEEFLGEYLEWGFVERCDEIKACFPVRLIPKKNSDKMRLVHDLRELNKFFPSEKYKLRTIFDVLKRNCQFMIKIDLKHCYFHFKLREEFSKWFGFQVNGVKYKFNVLPFGFSRAPFLVKNLLKPLE